MIDNTSDWNWLEFQKSYSASNSFEIELTILTDNTVRVYGVISKNNNGTLLNYVVVPSSLNPQKVNLFCSPQSAFDSIGCRIVLVSSQVVCYCDDLVIKRVD